MIAFLNRGNTQVSFEGALEVSDPKLTTKQGKRLVAVAGLVEAFEKQRWPIAPVEALGVASKPSEIAEQLSEIDEEIILADGFDEALLGYVEVFNKTIALYDRTKCLQILMDRDGMSEDSAIEFFEYNVTGSYVGERTPGFATLL